MSSVDSARLRRHTPTILLVVMLVVCALAPVLPFQDPFKMIPIERFSDPTSQHWLGQDEYGRDIVSRLVWAARNSLVVAVSSTLLATIIGTILGVLAGFHQGLTEAFTMRSIDVLICFPPLLLAMVAVTLYGPGPVTLVPVLAIIFVPGFTRVAHASVMTVRSQDYVGAARSMGASNGRVMLTTILPNIAGAVLVQFSVTVASAIVLESGLSFLGLGVMPPAPSLGLMIGTGRATLDQQPMLLVWPCLALTIVILILNAFCNLMRDIFDPASSDAGRF